jgi:hypothetical protein
VGFEESGEKKGYPADRGSKEQFQLPRLIELVKGYDKCVYYLHEKNDEKDQRITFDEQNIKNLGRETLEFFDPAIEYLGNEIYQ